jgi:hypothetical protein
MGFLDSLVSRSQNLIRDNLRDSPLIFEGETGVQIHEELGWASNPLVCLVPSRPSATEQTIYAGIHPVSEWIRNGYLGYNHVSQTHQLV